MEIDLFEVVFFPGVTKAVDEYFEKIQYSTFLSRIDYTGRILVKK